MRTCYRIARPLRAFEMDVLYASRARNKCATFPITFSMHGCDHQ